MRKLILLLMPIMMIVPMVSVSAQRDKELPEELENYISEYDFEYSEMNGMEKEINDIIVEEAGDLYEAHYLVSSDKKLGLILIDPSAMVLMAGTLYDSGDSNAQDAWDAIIENWNLMTDILNANNGKDGLPENYILIVCNPANYDNFIFISKNGKTIYDFAQGIDNQLEIASDYLKYFN